MKLVVSELVSSRDEMLNGYEREKNIFLKSRFLEVNDGFKKR